MRVVRAMWRAEKLIATNPEKAKPAVQAYFPKLDAAIFDAAYRHSLPAVPRDPRVTREGIQRNLDFLAEMTGTGINVDVDKVFTNHIVDLASKSMK